jgi:hypothetical protein
MALVSVIPALIAVAWLAVVTATISVCRMAARADAAEAKTGREARRGGSVRRGDVTRPVLKVRLTSRKQTLRARDKGGLGLDAQLYGAAGRLAQLSASTARPLCGGGESLQSTNTACQACLAECRYGGGESPRDRPLTLPSARSDCMNCRL